MSTSAAFAVGALLLAQVALGQACFAPAAIYSSAGQYPAGVDAGDLNGDGLPDIVIANHSYFPLDLTGSIGVLFGQPGGGYAPAVLYPNNDNPALVAIADMDGDGFPDVVATNYPTHSVQVFWNNGDGTLTPGTKQSIAIDGLGDLVIHDMDGDGKLDMLISAANPGPVKGVHNLGQRQFAAAQALVTFGATEQADSINVADMDGDGIEDLVIGTFISADVGRQVLARGLGPMAFAAPISILSTAGASWGRLADLNGDGRPDLIAIQYAPNGGHGFVSILMNGGEGTFGEPVTYNVSYRPFRLAIDDFNQDGHPDIAILYYFSNGIRVMNGAGGASFGAETFYSTTGAPQNFRTMPLPGSHGPAILVAVGNTQAIGKAVVLSNNGGPLIAGGPHDTIATIGGSAGFSATGTEATFLWRHNGIALTDDARFSGSHTSTLSITGVLGRDVGAYELVVTNACGTSTSATAYLRIACSADFDNDGDAGTDADIEALFACIAGNCCATCGPADFNADGDAATDADIESFFRVLAGGAC